MALPLYSSIDKLTPGFSSFPSMFLLEYWQILSMERNASNTIGTHPE